MGKVMPQRWAIISALSCQREAHLTHTQVPGPLRCQAPSGSLAFPETTADKSLGYAVSLMEKNEKSRKLQR